MSPLTDREIDRIIASAPVVTTEEHWRREAERMGSEQALTRIVQMCEAAKVNPNVDSRLVAIYELALVVRAGKSA